MRIDELVKREKPVKIRGSERGPWGYKGPTVTRHEITIDENEGGYDPSKGDGQHIHRLYHFGTLMAKWDCNEPNLGEFNLGIGSVSDQNLMNELFQALGLPYRMDRDKRGGGPRISDLPM